MAVPVHDWPQDHEFITHTHTWAHTTPTPGTRGGLGTVHRRHYVLHAQQTAPTFLRDAHQTRYYRQTLPATITFAACHVPVRQGYAVQEPPRSSLVLYKMCPRLPAACERALLLPHAIAVVTARSGKYRELSLPSLPHPLARRIIPKRDWDGIFPPADSQRGKGTRSTTTG
jgi:hypothetical protein